MLAALPPGNNFQAIRNGLSKTSSAKKKHPFSGTQAFDTSYTKQVSSELSKPQQHNPPRKSASLFNLSSKSGLMSHMTKTDTQSKIFTKKNCSTGQMAIAINEHEVHLGPLSDSLQGFGVVPFPSRISPGLLNTEVSTTRICSSVITPKTPKTHPAPPKDPKTHPAPPKHPKTKFQGSNGDRRQ